MRGSTLTTLIFTLLSAATAFGTSSPWKFTFEGYVEDTNGPVDDTKAFRFQMIGVSGTQRCILYDENQSLKVDKGNFVARIGDGTRVTGSDPGLTLKQIYGSQTLPLTAVRDDVGGACASFDQVNGERYVRVYLESEKVGDVLVTRAPMATQAAQAGDADKVGGKAAADLIQVDTLKNVTQNQVVDVFDTLYLVAPGSSARWNSSTKKFEAYDYSNGALLTDASVSWTKLKDIPAPLSDLGAAAIAGCADGKILKRVSSAWACADDSAGSFGGVTSANPYLGVASGSTAPVLTLNVGTVSNTVAAGDDSRFGDATSIHNVPIDVTGLSNNKVLKYDGTKWIAGDDNTGSGVATDLASLVSGASVGIVQRNNANSFSSVMVASPLSYTGGTLGINVGSASGQVAAGDDARFTDSRPPNGAAGGELGGNYPNPTIAKLGGASLSITSPTGGQVLKYNGTSWVNAADAGIGSELDPTVTAFAKLAPGNGLSIDGTNHIQADFGTTTGKVAQGSDARFPGTTCASGNYSRWNGTAWACDVASATDSTKLPLAGGTMTGNITMGTNKIGFGASVDQIHMFNNSNVAMTMNSPTTGQAMLNFMTGGSSAQSLSAGTGKGWQFYSYGSTASTDPSSFGLTYYNGGGWYQAMKINPSVSGTTGGEIGFYAGGSGSVERMRIQNDGKVGIGTSAPGSPLHVKDSSAQTIATFESGSSLAGVTLKAGSPTYAPTIYGSSTGDLTVYTGGNNRLQIANSGAVSVMAPTSFSANVDSAGRYASVPKTNADALGSANTITVDFSSANTVRSTASTGAACGTLNVTNTTPGAYHTFTIPLAQTTCATILKNGVSTGIKLPSGYGNMGVSGIIYTFLDDGATLWVSYVPF